MVSKPQFVHIAISGADGYVGIEGVWDASVYSLEEVKEEVSKTWFENYNRKCEFGSDVGEDVVDIQTQRVSSNE